jgi:hypothetical protein
MFDFELVLTVTYALIAPYGTRRVRYHIPLEEECDEDVATNEAFEILAAVKHIRGVLCKDPILALAGRPGTQVLNIDSGGTPSPEDIQGVFLEDVHIIVTKKISLEWGD